MTDWLQQAQLAFQEREASKNRLMNSLGTYAQNMNQLSKLGMEYDSQLENRKVNASNLQTAGLQRDIMIEDQEWKRQGMNKIPIHKKHSALLGEYRRTGNKEILDMLQSDVDNEMGWSQGTARKYNWYVNTDTKESPNKEQVNLLGNYATYEDTSGQSARDRNPKPTPIIKEDLLPIPNIVDSPSPQSNTGMFESEYIKDGFNSPAFNYWSDVSAQYAAGSKNGSYFDRAKNISLGLGSMGMTAASGIGDVIANIVFGTGKRLGLVAARFTANPEERKYLPPIFKDKFDHFEAVRKKLESFKKFGGV